MIPEQPSKVEPLKEGWEEFKPRPSAYAIFSALSRDLPQEQTLSNGERVMTSMQVIDGFEDLLAGSPLGDGLFYNTMGGTLQLGFALATVSHEAIKEVLKSKTALSSFEKIKKLRDAKVLSEIKILDLGSGGVPGFALAAQALGATVYTVDGEDMLEKYKSHLAGHVIVNMNDKEAVPKMLSVTGGNFDIVTENIIGTVPDRGFKGRKPSWERIQEIAGPLLKNGGKLFSLSMSKPHSLKK